LTSPVTLTIPVRRRSPEEVAATAHRVLDAALAVAGWWASSEAARQASRDLDEAVGNFTAVESGAVHWEAYYPELRTEADPHGEALDRLAGEACMAMAMLLVAIGATAGKGLASAIRNTARQYDENGPQISPAGRAECASADDTPTTQGVHQSDRG